MIERYTLNEENYASKKFLVNGKSIEITGVFSTVLPNSIEHKSFNKTLVSQGEFEVHGLCEVDDFFKDIGFLLKNIEGKDITIPTLFQILADQLVNHVTEFERLIDTDLYSYLDLFILTSTVLSNHFVEIPNLTDEISFDLWTTLKNKFFEDLEEFIWINYKPGSPEHSLIPLSEFKNLTN